MKLIRTILVITLVFSASMPCYGLMKKSISAIEPGVGLGDIKIGDKLSTVMKKMDKKKPTDGKAVKAGEQTEYWLSYADIGVTFIFNEKEDLQRIAVSNPGIVVQQSGIRVNSSVKDLERIYGKGVSDRKKPYEQRTYSDKGISFTINKDTGRIEVITIEKITIEKKK